MSQDIHTLSPQSQTEPASLVAVVNDTHAINKLYQERRWGDGLPVVPPTEERVNEMLAHTKRTRDEVVATLAPGFGAATVELIAINGVLSGCEPSYLPVLIAAVEAISEPRFNLQGLQATTNPATVWLIVNGPIAEQLEINGGLNCLGQGAWANATLGRGLHLIMQNIGGAFPGDMDRATHGQPGKYTFCCAENAVASSWPPLHVERGFSADSSTVTVVAASGTLNLLTHEKDAMQLLRVLADSMRYPTSNDYWCGGAPWMILGPEHADVLAAAGLSKADVKRHLWEQSKMTANRRAPKDYVRTQQSRRAELGEISENTLLPISPTPDDIGIIVAGGPGTHSVYVPTLGNSRSVTQPIAVA